MHGDRFTSMAGSLALAMVLAAGCKPGAPAGKPAGRECRSALGPVTRTFLDDREDKYLQARGKARAWADGLEVDPRLLREHGIKGKKKLVELLDLYVWLLRDPLPGQEKGLRDRVKEIVAITYEASYHDMATVSDEEFKQDATSYMRAAYLMDGLGLDTKMYRSEMRKVLGRFDAHMHERGPAQRMIFHLYYEHFGFEEPLPLTDAFASGVIASRADPQAMETMTMYHLTHEIFMPFRYGEVRESDFFSPDDMAYLERALPVMAKRRIEANDPDLVGEIALCLEYIDAEGAPEYGQAIDYLLGSQNADGSWGSYPQADARFGEWARYHVYLHTTKLALTALIDAFRCPG